MSIVDLPQERAERAGAKVVEQKTCVPLLDIDPLTAAEFLAVRDWRRRGRWADSIIVDSLETLQDKILPILHPDDEEGQRVTVRECIADFRTAIGLTLSHLERLGPLPLNDPEAMRIYRVSGNPEHVARAVRFFRTERDELVALRRKSGCMFLRNASIALHAPDLVRPGGAL